MNTTSLSEMLVIASMDTVAVISGPMIFPSKFLVSGPLMFLDMWKIVSEVNKSNTTLFTEKVVSIPCMNIFMIRDLKNIR